MIDFEDIDYKRLDEETEDDYTLRICALKEIKHLYWDEIAQIINRTLDQNYTESRYRKMYSAYTKGKADAVKEEEIPEISEYMQQKIELQKERIKISDERVQTNAYIRQLAREETIKEIASKCAQEMNSKKLLEAPKELYISGKNAAILQLSDIHYGLVVDNYWNKYNPDIAKNKISQLRDKVIQYCEFNDVSDLYITELGDAIAGRIHETIKYQSRFDVITQIMQISEIIAEMITDLSKHFKIHYYCCLDNHSRLEPNKKAALDLESLARIIPWYLKERVGAFIEINDNKYGEDIITFKCKGFNIAGCHGDKDSPIKVVDNLSMMTRENFDMVLTAHLHHFSADEKNQILVISNPSILSTDDYSKNLRLSSKSAQNLIIVSDENVMECLYRIVLK
uniref:DNA polymerase II small subunit n=1 Tax=Siphoviridae sp. ctEw721 TaxID=2825400 RepID=A0A8S5TRY1_9CAUD|nr:MAG TPA: DNA polymerase II small subunit [Siphoviridae sp. ctEw721]DAH11439.1 MAG TPA: DNA polymerase II small subunit [Caudoviricetes sp.]